MIKIRLKREGVKNKPFYRIVVGKSLDVLGFYNPIKKILKVDRKKVSDWIAQGAQVTPTVKKLLEG